MNKNRSHSSKISFSCLAFLYPPSCLFCTALSRHFKTAAEKALAYFFLISHLTEFLFLDGSQAISWWGGDVLVASAKGEQSVQCTVCLSLSRKNPVTYKSIRNVHLAESICPIPIVRKSKILRKILFQELLFKTMQSLFRVKSRYLEIWVSF